jgi:protein-S-isoprenylcysteine O-methyltransferase Ste14
MADARAVQPQLQQQVPDTWVRLGGWLFKRRTALPLPIVALLLIIPAPEHMSARVLWTGMAVIASGEWLRLWAIRHIGAISRTRSERLGPLVSTGPFAWVRNPLYIGNVLLWAGFTMSAGFPVLVPLVVGVLAVEYHAMVRWEEGLLESRLGEAYRAYARRVRRWFPSRAPSDERREGVGRFSWRETLFSERGTLIAIALGFLLLWLK